MHLSCSFIVVCSSKILVGKNKKKSLKIIPMKKSKASFAIDVESANEYVWKELNVIKGLDVIGIQTWSTFKVLL